MGLRSKLNVQGRGGGRISDVNGQRVGGLENWTIFMDVICLSSLSSINDNYFSNDELEPSINS